jgi:hypothetical protein
MSDTVTEIVDTETKVKNLEYFLDSYFSVSHSSRYLEHDINVEYYDGLDIENTFSIYELGYKNIESLSFIERSLIFNIVDYIRLNPESFFLSQVELVVFILNKTPILIFRNHNNVCDRCIVINIDKIIEEDKKDFKFLRKTGFNFGKFLTGIGLIGLISSIIYYKIKVKK